MQLLNKLKRPRYWLSALVVLLVLWIIFSPERPPSLKNLDLTPIESEIVERGDVVEIVSGTGTVSASDEVILSFEAQGTISSINVSEGSRVNRGSVLASLNTSLLQNDVDSAYAVLLSQEAKLQEMRSGLSPTEEAAALARLESARFNLLTADLRAYFTGRQVESGALSYVPPIISGTYMGDEQGEYRITIYRSSAQSGYSFRYFGLESGTGEISVESPKPLGSKGLYIQFPENFARDANVEWLVEIPNTRSNQYTSLQRAYNQALADYNLAVEGPRSEQIAAQEALVEQARANHNRAQNALNRAMLSSPISGIVTSLPIVIGQTVSPGQVVASVVSENDHKITLWVSESDVANISVGDVAEVELLAFPNEIFSAEVVYVSPAAESRDGVSSFKVELYFVENYERIRSGMTADVDIFSHQVENVLSVPGRSIARMDNVNFVRVIINGSVEERQVETGLRGYDGRVEIVSGLEEGDEVITFITEENLNRLLSR